MVGQRIAIDIDLRITLIFDDVTLRKLKSEFKRQNEIFGYIPKICDLNFPHPAHFSHYFINFRIVCK